MSGLEEVSGGNVGAMSTIQHPDTLEVDSLLRYQPTAWGSAFVCMVQTFINSCTSSFVLGSLIFPMIKAMMKSRHSLWCLEN